MTRQNSAVNEAMTETPNAQPTPCLMRRIHEKNKKKQAIEVRDPPA